MNEYPIGVMVVAAIGLFSAIMMAREPDTRNGDVEVAQSSAASPAVQFPAQAWPQEAPQRNLPVAAAPMPSPIPTVMPQGYIPPSGSGLPMTAAPIASPRIPVQRAVPMMPSPPNK